VVPKYWVIAPVGTVPANGSTVAEIVMFAEPSKDAEPDKFPPREMVLEVANLVAVVELPLMSITGRTPLKAPPPVAFK
jgi:hypothetical protein